jgi:Zn-dependent protease with chaperone function
MWVLCVFAAFLMGIPLALVLTPFLYAVTIAAAEVISYFSPLPPQFWQAAGDMAKLAVDVANALANQSGTIDPQALAIMLLLVFVPGIALALFLWLGVLLLFRDAGVGGTIASLNAREPNRTDLKELQLADVTQEMAIAAGLPPPRLMLMDAAGANAAAIGTSPADAHIVLSRRLLDDLDRDQLQALVGQLIASVGNGDLHIAFTVSSVFETCGLMVALINAPFGRHSRSTLWRIIRYPFRAGQPSQSADAEQVAELLADTLDMNSTDIDRFFSGSRPGLVRKLLRLLFFPFQFTNMAVELTLWFFLNVLLGPSMALLWRTRRYLADAGAVELTRNPDALSGALQRLSEDDNNVGGGAWAAQLFVVNPSGDHSGPRVARSMDVERKALKALQAAQADAAPPADTAPASSGMDPQALMRIRKEIMTAVMAAAAGDSNAAARLQTFVQAMGGPSALGLQGMPNFNDILLAKQGDRAALTRLRMLRERSHEDRAAKRGQTGLQTYSFVSFHPPLEKRAKRLQRMGAQATPSRKAHGIVFKIFLALLYLIIAPLLAAGGILMLFVIAMMICLNLVFLALWLAVIHWAFAQDWQRNIQAFVSFIQEVSAVLNKAR